MLKTQIDRILEVERDAKERIAAAERQAKSLLDEAREQRGKLIEQTRVSSLTEAEHLVQRATEDAAREKGRILEEAHAKAEGYISAIQHIDASFYRDAARSIAGIRP